MRPSQPDWLVEHGLDRRHLVALHTSDCWIAARSGRCVAVTRAQAMDALRQHVPACTHCRRDTALGFLG
ncbi:DUF6233 domain-containing protein [Streptomyces sp. NPDC056190]|uniref:DUF6233 domain-containing protein n=1 Tax=unclassified Streptomyces TaxID=2593676 RepID=UPI0035DC89C5